MSGPVIRRKVVRLAPGVFKALVDLGDRCTDDATAESLWSAAFDASAGNPHVAGPAAVKAAVGGVANAVVAIVRRNLPTLPDSIAHGLKPGESLVDHLPQWAREILAALGEVEPPDDAKEHTDPGGPRPVKDDHDLIQRAARAGILIVEGK